jgi:PilZ domain
MQRWQPPGHGSPKTASSSSSEKRTAVKTIEERRQISRQEAGWIGKWRLVGDPTSSSLKCRVLDISMRGAGIETRESRHANLIGKRVAVTAQPLAGGSISVRFSGVVRNVGRSGARIDVPARGQERLVRLGIEFVGLAPDELAMLNMLGQFLQRRT